MKIKCPSCGKVLSIPEAAAGKIVKCPCGKQLRAPGGAAAPAGAAAKAPGPKPASPKPAPQKPASRPAAKKAAARPAAAAPALDDELFGELTDKDLSPVKSVYSPGQQVVTKGGPANDGEAGRRKKSKPKIIGGVLAVVLGLAMIGAFFAGFGKDDNSEGLRLRRRSPIGIGVVMIVTGLGWVTAGWKGSVATAESE